MKVTLSAINKVHFLISSVFSNLIGILNARIYLQLYDMHPHFWLKLGNKSLGSKMLQITIIKESLPSQNMQVFGYCTFFLSTLIILYFQQDF